MTFINEYDQQKFQQIETLIAATINKIALPEGFPAGPLYNPDVRIKKPFSGKKKPNFIKDRRPARK